VRPDGFFVGLHQPSDAHRFQRVCISINRLRGRKKPLGAVDVLIDSGAFTELNLFGRYRHGVEEYAAELYRLHSTGVVRILAAVAQDYMCEDFMLARTDATNEALAALEYGPAPKAALISIHQKWTIERYDALVEALDRLFDGDCPFPVIPVLQGYSPADYVRHLVAYGDRLKPGMWVGVGSVCKRNSNPDMIAEVLEPIVRLRPDLRLHGFGVKQTALFNAAVRQFFETTDSMAWSFAARRQGRDGNSPAEAAAFVDKIADVLAAEPQPWQMTLDLGDYGYAA
jgi:hypothetical protein